MSTNSPGEKADKDREEVMQAIQQLVEVGENVLSSVREMLKGL